MKGEKTYLKSASLIHTIYETLNESKKRKLYTEYIFHLRKAAYAGHGRAQWELGQEHEDINCFGPNPNYDPKRCLYWYTKACNNNIAEACNNLASLYGTGTACKVNNRKALSLYKKAADLGDDLAKNNYRQLKKELSR